MAREKQTQTEWSNRVAALAVDGLLTKGLLKEEDFQVAFEIVAEEILVRLCLHDFPPVEDPPAGSNDA